MSTNENEILEKHRLRMEFRDDINRLIEKYWNKAEMDDIAAELIRSHSQLVGFISNHAYQVAIKKEKEEHDKEKGQQ